MQEHLKKYRRWRLVLLLSLISLAACGSAAWQKLEFFQDLGGRPNTPSEQLYVVEAFRNSIVQHPNAWRITIRYQMEQHLGEEPMLLIYDRRGGRANWISQQAYQNGLPIKHTESSLSGCPFQEDEVLRSLNAILKQRKEQPLYDLPFGGLCR